MPSFVRSAHHLTVATVLAVASLSLVGSGAYGQAPRGTGAGRAHASDTAAPERSGSSAGLGGGPESGAAAGDTTGANERARATARQTALRLAAGGDLAAARAAVAEATRLGEGDGATTLVAAFVSRVGGDLEAALPLFERAATEAGATDPTTVGRALHGVASTLERLGRTDDARAAWERYASFADAHREAVPPTIGRARVAALDAAKAASQSAAAVRARAEERTRRATTTPVNPAGR